MGFPCGWAGLWITPKGARAESNLAGGAGHRCQGAPALPARQQGWSGEKCPATRGHPDGESLFPGGTCWGSPLRPGEAFQLPVGSGAWGVSLVNAEVGTEPSSQPPWPNQQLEMGMMGEAQAGRGGGIGEGSWQRGRWEAGGPQAEEGGRSGRIRSNGRGG